MKRVFGALAGTAVLALAGCGGDDGGDVQAFCDQAQEALAVGANLAAPLASGDVEAAKEAINAASGQLQEAADLAPDEISDDFDVVSGYESKLNESLQDAQSPEEIDGVSKELKKDAQGVTEAGNNVEAYISENCDQSS